MGLSDGPAPPGRCLLHTGNHGSLSEWPIVNDMLGLMADLVGGSGLCWCVMGGPRDALEGTPPPPPGRPAIVPLAASASLNGICHRK